MDSEIHNTPEIENLTRNTKNLTQNESNVEDIVGDLLGGKGKVKNRKNGQNINKMKPNFLRNALIYIVAIFITMIIIAKCKLLHQNK